MTTTPELPKGADPLEVDFDAEALKARYDAERDKRLRSDGIGQYVELKGEFAHYLDDPYVAPGYAREPLTDEVEILIVGGGFSGLLTGARLRQYGFEDIRIIEAGGDFGGTWYWNRYPGAACDVESYIYLPLLEDVGYLPVEKYSRAAEIRTHTQAIARKHDLYRDVCFQTQVTELRWDGADGRWIVRTNRDDAIRARFVVMANGPLNSPKLPGIPGVETFQGKSFHTSRWDYEYTGGDASGNLTGLRDKRVGIIGTGATAVQAVPHLGASAQHLYVFQRTPSSVDVRANRPTDAEWAASLEAGWQKQRMDNFNALVSGVYQETDLVGDRWTDILHDVVRAAEAARTAGSPDPDPAELALRADFRKMEEIRARVDSVVTDPEVAAKLKPYYYLWCKRPCFSDEYLPTFNRPNVTLVDTDGKGVDRITPHGVVVAGREYEIDCLVYATGFEVGTSYTRRAGYEIYGRDGLTLSDKWADGVVTLHGMLSHGFPNVFILGSSQAGFSVNYPHVIGDQTEHLAYLIKTAGDRGARVVEATEAAEKEWVETIVSLAGARSDFLKDCTPGYYNQEGKRNDLATQGTTYGAGPIAFAKVLANWRATGEQPGVVMR